MVSSKSVSFSNIFPDVAQGQAALAQRQAIVDELKKSALTPFNPANYAPGVVMSPWEGIANIGQALLANKEQKSINQKNLDLAQELNNRLWGTRPWQNPDGASANVPVDKGSSVLGSALADMIGGKPEATMQPTLGTPAQQAQSGGMIQQAFPNIPQRQLMLAMQMAPDKLGESLVSQYTPTDTMKNYQQAGMSPQEIAAAIRGEAANKGTINATPGNTLLMPGGQRFVAPQFDKNIAGGYDVQGNPVVSQIPGAAGAAANLAGTVKGAEQANTIFPGQVVNGRENVPVPGSQIMNQTRAGQFSGVDKNGDIVSEGSPNAVQFGQTPAEKSAGSKQGESAASANEGYQKSKATTDAINAALDRLEAINPDAPSGDLGIAHVKAALSNTLSPLIPGKPSTAMAAQEWEQLTGQNILSGLKQLQGLGRLDLPEVNQVIKTYGIGLENSPEVRAQGLKNLRTMLKNNLVASQNTVAGINTPNVPQVPTAQVQPYQNVQSRGVSTGQRIKVIAPNGQTGTVDAAHLQDILSQGGKVVQ